MGIRRLTKLIYLEIYLERVEVEVRLIEA